MKKQEMIRSLMVLSENAKCYSEESGLTEAQWHGKLRAISDIAEDIARHGFEPRESVGDQCKVCTRDIRNGVHERS